MTAVEIIGLILAILTLIGGLEMRVRALVKTYLNELKPNGGSSMKDQINRLEARVDTILELLNK